MGVSRNWWDLAGIDMTGQEKLTWGSSMRWVRAGDGHAQRRWLAEGNGD